ncbi:hypothetical protein JCM19239_5830 [Vibrio variabilis]|uniref:Uncharacterized protein n=1 Tax=Vibrio variabilis TaxID=990271 RepID=A0ABQ0J8A5_9VIBR|nr:hypothetical protein JCM19239_5830 [Vibrio variabilis]
MATEVQYMKVTLYSKKSGMGVKQIKARMDIGEIPEVLHLREGGDRYVDCVRLEERLLLGELEFSDLSKRQKDEA